jgi:hypothetical protein
MLVPSLFDFASDVCNIRPPKVKQALFTIPRDNLHLSMTLQLYCTMTLTARLCHFGEPKELQCLAMTLQLYCTMTLTAGLCHFGEPFC